MNFDIRTYPTQRAYELVQAIGKLLTMGEQQYEDACTLIRDYGFNFGDAEEIKSAIKILTLAAKEFIPDFKEEPK